MSATLSTKPQTLNLTVVHTGAIGISSPEPLAVRHLKFVILGFGRGAVALGHNRAEGLGLRNPKPSLLHTSSHNLCGSCLESIILYSNLLPKDQKPKRNCIGGLG